MGTERGREEVAELDKGRAIAKATDTQPFARHLSRCQRLAQMCGKQARDGAAPALVRKGGGGVLANA